MANVNFSDFEEIKQLINLTEVIPGLECNYPVNFDLGQSIEFTYHENGLEYMIFVTPKFCKKKVCHYKLYDKVSAITKELIAKGSFENSSLLEFFVLEGSLFQPQKATYDEVVSAISNIDMNDAYDPSKKFWINNL